MHALRSVVVAFSMFSTVPMPHIPWDERSMRHALVAFPLVGLLVGALLWGAARLCGLLALPRLLRALVLTALPLVVTGGIHLDGFCDTWDALSSHGDPERMRQILKDPHIGAFGVMHLVLLLLATFVLWAELDLDALAAAAPATGSLATVAPPAAVAPLATVSPLAAVAPLVCPPVLSRALAGLSVATFPLAQGDGLARTFAEKSDRRDVRLGCAVIALIAAGMVVAAGAWAMVAVAALVFVWYRARVVRQFGGLSGDLCGWFVQTSELWMLGALYATQALGVIA